MGRLLPSRWPLALQLVAAFALVTALASAVGGALLLRQATSRMLGDRSASVLARANTAANLAAELLANPEGLTLSLYRFQRQTGVRPLFVDRAGIVIADVSHDSPVLGVRLVHPEVVAALEGRQVTGTRTLPGGEWVMYGAVPVDLAGERVGAVMVAADIAHIGESLERLQRQLYMVVAVMEILAVLLGILLARYLARPLVGLSAAATELAKGRLETRVQPGGSRELQDLGHSFNRMAAELNRLDGQRRAFVADASHDLRTPVASIRALAEALLADRQGDESTRQEYLTDIVRECDRAGRLSNRLLELARLDMRREARGAKEPLIEPVLLQDVVEEVVHAFEPLAQESGVALELSLSGSAVARLDPRLIETALGNLIENGLKYTPHGGRVSVEVSIMGGRANLLVTDTGIGISAEDLPHIFERFYRVDRARARKTGGAGLGLAIAAEAATLLGGQLTVTSELGQGSRFTLSFPV